MEALSQAGRGTLRRGAAAALIGLLTAASMLLTVAGAAAAAPHEPLGSFGPCGNETCEFKNNTGLAFAEAERRLFVADLQTDEVWGFDISSPPPPFPGLTGFSPLIPPGPLQGEFGILAIDNTATASAGRLYLALGSGAATELAAYGPGGAPPAGFPVTVPALSGQAGMAVDPRDGVIATLDKPSKSVRGYSPEGYRLDDLVSDQPFSPRALAFDSDGDIYLALQVSGSVNEIRKYSAASGYQQSTQLYSGPVVEALAVDPSTHHLFAALKEKVLEFDAEGNQLEEFAETPGGKYRGLAVDPANHDVYVSDAGAKGSEKQKVTIAGATGGHYKLCFEAQCTGATGKGSLAGPATGSGDVVRVSGIGNLTAGHTEVTHVTTSGGEFKAGMVIAGPGIAAGTTITYANPETQTIALSAPPSGDKAGASLQAGYIANLETTSGEFKAGMEVFGPGIPESGFPKPNLIASVNSDGTLTLQGVPTEASEGAALSASSKTITNVSTESGAFVQGESITGTGIPAGATIACVGRGECPGNTLTLSAAATASAAGAALSADLVCGIAGGNMRSALEKLPTIGAGNVSVSGSGECQSPPVTIARTVSFQGDFLGEDVPLLTCDATGLEPGGATCEVETTEAASVPDPGRVRVYSAGQTVPLLKLADPTALTGTSVTLNGSVNPEGIALSGCHFDYVTEAAFAATGFADLSSGGSAACNTLPSGSSYQPVSAAISGLTPGVRYRYRIAVQTPSGLAGYPGGAFATPAPPQVETTGSPVPEPTEALLSGRLNTRGKAAEYRFEYGTAGPCDSSACAATPWTAVSGEEVQRFDVAGLVGSYTLSYEGAETPPLHPEASAAEVQAALVALPTLGAGEVTVTGGTEGGSGSFVVSFGGALAGANVAPLTKTLVSGGKAEIANTLIQGGPRDEVSFAAARVGGLEPEATYHYRLVAKSEGGESLGSDMTLKTRSSTPPTNADFPHPPDSERAYELVSLPDSGGNPSAYALGFSAGGDKALYQVSGGTPISQQGSFFNQLLAERVETAPHEGEWRSRLLAPASIYGKEAPDWLFAPTPDLSRFIGENNNSKEAAPEIHYWRLAPGGPYESLRDVGIHQASTYFEVSADGSRVATAVKGALDPAHPMSAAEAKLFHLYDVSDPAEAHLLSLMPGVAASCGVATQSAFGSIGEDIYSMNHDADHSGWVSGDGSRAFFESEEGCAGAPLQLWEREIEAGQTKLISGPARSGPTCPAAFLRATGDAVFFLTATRLSEEDTAPVSCSTGGGKGGDVYRYDLGSGKLACITCSTVRPAPDIELFKGAAFSALQVVGVSEDGSAVYFASPNRLLAGAAGSGIYRVDVACQLEEASCPEGPLSYVAPAQAGAKAGAGMGGESVVSADGDVLVFKSADARLSAQGGTRNEGTAQYYRYAQSDRSLDCLSCPQDGSSPVAAVRGSRASGSFTYELTYNGTMTSADGQVSAYSSPSPLVGADQNTATPAQNPYSGRDVYEWRGDHPVLVTDGITQWNPAGKGSSEQQLKGTPEPAGVSADGKNVFFFAAAKLTPEAIDDYNRLYDARLGGGFTPPAEPQPCPLEVCQGTPAGTPEEQQPASRELQGAGNPAAPPARCRKGKVRRRGRCVRKRHRRRHHRHHRHHGKARHGKARHHKAGHGKARHHARSAR